MSFKSFSTASDKVRDDSTGLQEADKAADKTASTAGSHAAPEDAAPHDERAKKTAPG